MRLLGIVIAWSAVLFGLFSLINAFGGFFMIYINAPDLAETAGVSSLLVQPKELLIEAGTGIVLLVAGLFLRLRLAAPSS